MNTVSFELCAFVGSVHECMAFVSLLVLGRDKYPPCQNPSLYDQ
ncbi:hypothetical protein SLEP1_g28603 [Rubroshorea leprosula]|uniref:Uncharacterized protein n=1 Tax=Rubroshorea leprosula TaxID=152421 RepID=A0AAV5K1B0_9ROSI|nr:hypothetical protein SLEP1_g28603 [Rubroshorea leprosula]